MIYDELIEELALTLLTKARYEGCISVIDGFSQCEEDALWHLSGRGNHRTARPVPS